MNDLVLEGAKLIITSYFNYMRLHGKTEEEIKSFLDAAKLEFDQNNPNTLEDV